MNSCPRFLADQANSDLACSLYLRGRKDTKSGARMAEIPIVEAQADRAVANMMAFLAKATG
ncbi:hypothetical protein ACFQ1S_05605 [Kibdelosporangium lantanae]|uniref:Uncharacterized protein n=1 Tax=Kibdelosporangium lantanae TaxID=1497396 RepID=A0ABW3M484_9PSEU